MADPALHTISQSVFCNGFEMKELLLFKEQSICLSKNFQLFMSKIQATCELCSAVGPSEFGYRLLLNEEPGY